jgi:hypothetical protein
MARMAHPFKVRGDYIGEQRIHSDNLGSAPRGEIHVGSPVPISQNAYGISEKARSGCFTFDALTLGLRQSRSL